MIFLGAGFGRAVSSWFLASQSEPVRPDEREQSVKLIDFLRRLGRGTDGKLLLYLLAVQASVQISGPYFTPYMLRHLDFSYAQYMTLIAGAFLAKVMALPALGQVAHRCGARRLMVWGGTGMVPLAAAWLVSDSYWYLMGVQIVGGVAWAAYELGMFLMFFEAIHEHERTSVLTSFNFGNALAVACGSLLGGTVLWIVGPQREVYLALFAVSSLARLASLALVRPVPESAGRIFRIALRTLAVRPMGGIEERPILASLPQDENGSR
jgi:MFS family permease